MGKTQELRYEYIDGEVFPMTGCTKPHNRIAFNLATELSVNCSECGAKVTKALSNRTHKCKCGCNLGRDENAARNILALGLRTVGHIGSQAWGDQTPYLLVSPSPHLPIPHAQLFNHFIHWESVN
jgi:hypothetical protein